MGKVISRSCGYFAIFGAVLCSGAPGACFAAGSPKTVKVTLAGWPDVTGLTVKADGAGNKLTFYAAGVELATISPKKNVTLFDLLPVRGCGSTTELGKLVSLLLTLDHDRSPANGVQIAFPSNAPAQGRLVDMTEAELIALEKKLTGRGMTVRAALHEANASLDFETWTESAAERSLFENDMGTIKRYLDRARATLAQTTPSLSGFGDVSEAEIAKMPATMKSQGLAFDGAAPVFSWRYGLQRADARYDAVLSRPLAIPADIMAEHYDPAEKKGFSHIGDIDIAGGRLYAPVEDEDHFTKAYVAIFDPRTLEYTGEKHPLPVGRIAWIGVDEKRGVFYTIIWNSQELLVFDLRTFQLARTVPLTVLDSGSGGSSAAGKTGVSRVQGAKVRSGMLYASSDSADDVPGPGGSKLKRKRVYKIDPVSGGALELFSFDEPDLAASQGLAFGPDGKLHVLVLAPYFYDSSFGPEYEINGDDWNPSAKLMRYVLTKESLREKICRMEP